MEKNLGYFARRAAEERRAAAEAVSDEARQRHLEMAAAYELRVDELKVAERRSEMNVVKAG